MTPNVTSPARSGSVRRARPRQASPATRDTRASGYSQPISGPHRLLTSFVQPPERPRNPPALYSCPVPRPVAGATRSTGPPPPPPPPPPNEATEPGNETPNRSTPL